ncbi:hypothetical protein SAMN05428953_12377 [Mesorhizobium muleiense]|uniref:Uncharacterized protein n=1 Tax=Mesorhizobium muleiense TaxID=1004279 RepID=A0A1G9FZY7_9HYPH|nr:hypothetical protein SAMN05428953_12377 [Mesorhizobium muleiense]
MQSIIIASSHSLLDFEGLEFEGRRGSTIWCSAGLRIV